jgi:IS605 OrfB family transposase
MTQLTTQNHVPREYDDACDRLTTLVEKHARRLLEDEYWHDRHFDAIQGHCGQSYTYIRDHSYDCFEDVDEYVYSRFKRCVYHRVTHVLDAHYEEYRAFHFITSVVGERKIKRIGWQRIRTQLFDNESPYISWAVVEECVEKLNRYYTRYGRFPENYAELVTTPEPNGTLPYAPDKGDYHIHDVELEDGEVVVTVNAPDSLSPGSYHDWTEHEFRLPTHDRFHQLVDAGDGLGAPTLHHDKDTGYVIDIPVDVPELNAEGEDDRVLAVDLGVKKQATCVPVEHSGDNGGHDQVAPPTFIDHHAKDKLFRIKADAEGVNDRLAALRRQGKDHTERFDHLLSEYRQTRRRERHLRRQIQHDVANQLVWVALHHNCSEIVFESLSGLDGRGHEGRTAWSISSWAHGELLDLVKYKAELVGLGVETVNPWGTSRYCPRCGERGKTVKAPDDHTEMRSGGHFHCSSCGYEGDRDVVGAINVGRKYLDGSMMEGANPAAYMEAGDHASFPSRPERCDRSSSDSTESVSGVQSAADCKSGEQDEVSGRQTPASQHRSPPLTVKRDGTTRGGLTQTYSGNTGLRWPSASITECCLLARITIDHGTMLSNPAEN